jgi:hypothetical protein
MNDHHEHQVIAKLNTAGDQLISGIIYIKLIMTRRAKKEGTNAKIIDPED